MSAVGDTSAAGVLAALAVGDQAAIEREDWAVFRNTGVAHLMSISGLHITMFAWLAALLVAPLWRRSTRAMLWLPAQRAAGWAGVAAALGYALFSGWGVPAQRTVWMLATVMLLRSLGRRWPWPLVLLAAAVVVTAGDPWRTDLAPATVYRALRRHRLHRLRSLEPREPVVRYCWPHAGDLVHLDTKKLGASAPAAASTSAAWP